MSLLRFPSLEVANVAASLGITDEALTALLRLPLDDARKGLDALRADVKKRYRAMAFRLHPDRNGGADAEFKRLSAAWTVLEPFLATLNVAPVPLPVVRIFFAGASYGGPFASSTSSTSGGYWSV